MTTNRKALVFWLVPRIHAALIVHPGLYFYCVVGEHGKSGNAVFAIVLKLVVAPDNAEIRLKLIESASRQSKAIDHRLPMLIGVRLTLVRSPLPSHWLGPVIDRSQILGERRIS